MDIVNGLGALTHHQFNTLSSLNVSAGGGDASFVYRGIALPLMSNPQGTSMRHMYVDTLDRTAETPQVSDAYLLSVAYICVLDVVRSLAVLFGEEFEEEGTLFADLPVEKRHLLFELVNSSWLGVMPALALFLETSCEASVIEALMKACQGYVQFSGRIGLGTSRDAFLLYMCKVCLPATYSIPLVQSFDGVPENFSSLPLNAENEQCGNAQIVAVSHGLTPGSNVSLTSKNLICMKVLLSTAAEYGRFFEKAWDYVLSTLEHFVWVLCLKPSSGGSLKASSLGEKTNTVITAVALSDIPNITALISRVFQKTTALDETALLFVNSSLVRISKTSMLTAQRVKEPSLFAVAKLLETGLVNLSRVHLFWDDVSGHLLALCQNPNAHMRCYAAEAVTQLVRSALCQQFKLAASDETLQLQILKPLSQICLIHHADVRLKQLECVNQILQSNGQQLVCGWPILLYVMESFDIEPTCDGLVRTAFVSLQLVVSDFLHAVPVTCLQQCITGRRQVRATDLRAQHQPHRRRDHLEHLRLHLPQPRHHLGLAR